MKSKEITQEKANERLVDTVNNFDWISAFIGTEKDDLLLSYRGLHSQLREGDELSIEIIMKNHDCLMVNVDYPCFTFKLYKDDGQMYWISPSERVLYRGIE